MGVAANLPPQFSARCLRRCVALVVVFFYSVSVVVMMIISSDANDTVGEYCFQGRDTLWIRLQTLLKSHLQLT